MAPTAESSVPSPHVVVIGGGPAGSTAATLIAQQGYRVQLFEREHFPRFHIGESLIPETYWVLKRLEHAADKMKASQFVKKYSVQFVNQHGRLSEPFYFLDHKPHESSQTWQVVRSEFDQMMLDNAREHGVEVHEGARVLEVLFEGDRAVGVRVQEEDGAEREVRAPVVVDASGQSSMIMSRLRLREWDPVLNKAALWTYWEGAVPRHRPGRGRHHRHPDAATRRAGSGTSRCTTTSSASAWSAGYDYLFKDRGNQDHEAIYFEEVERCPGVKPRIATARAGGPVPRRQGVFLSLHGRRPATAGCWSATPSASSIRSTPPACCWR